MRVCVVQTSSIDDKRANLDAAGRLIDRAAAEDRPDLVLLPEVFAFQGGTPEARTTAAEPVPGGETYTFLQETARRHGIVLHGGSYLERATDGRLYNTSVVLGPDGEEIARYRKIHLFDVVTPDGREYRESATVGRGSELVTYEGPQGVRVGCSICYDLRFGELYRALAAAGAELLMVPAAFTVPTGMAHWEVLLRARAIETGCYVAAAAQVGTYPAGKEQRACWGHSMIVDPWGKILVQVTDRPGLATARIDTGYLQRVREMIPVHQHRVLKG